MLRYMKCYMKYNMKYHMKYNNYPPAPGAPEQRTQ